MSFKLNCVTKFFFFSFGCFFFNCESDMSWQIHLYVFKVFCQPFEFLKMESFAYAMNSYFFIEYQFRGFH